MVLSLSLSKVSLPFVSHRLEGQVEGVEDVYGMTDIFDPKLCQCKCRYRE